MRPLLMFLISATVFSVAFALLWTALNRVLEQGDNVWSFVAAAMATVIIVVVNRTAAAITRMEGHR